MCIRDRVGGDAAGGKTGAKPCFAHQQNAMGQPPGGQHLLHAGFQDVYKRQGCNQCAFVCSHATIRPFLLTADELAAAPAQTTSRDNKLTPEYKFVIDVYKRQLPV